ncbi:MAG: glycosyltransferase family 4 protein [Sphingomonas bacterium]
MVAATRLAIVITHPVQHFVPFYRALAARPDIALHVLFGAPIGVKPYYDEEMQSRISWNMDMLGGYSHEFLGEAGEGMRSGLRTPSSPDVGKRLTAFAPDVVLLYGHAQVNVFRALFWCRTHGVPALTIGDSELLQQRSATRRLAKQIGLPLLLRQYSAALAVGDRNAEFYRHYGVRPDRIFRCPFTIDETAFRAAAANRATLRHQARQSFAIDDDAIVALFVGKLSARKRPGDILDALGHLARREGGRRRIAAIFAGNGEFAAQLQARAETEQLDARFAGFVNVDQLPSLYAAADIVVHPSQADPHPLICSEAACMGLPMVISDRVGAVGPTDIARPGENTIVYPCSDAAALADALAMLATDDALRDRMGKRSQEIFEVQDVEASIGGLLDAIAAVRR